MKTNLLKIFIVTTALIFTFTSASWADSRKNRNYNNIPGKHIQKKHYPAANYHQPAHYNQGWNKQHRKAVKNRHYRPKVVNNYYYAPRPVHKHYHQYAYDPYYVYGPYYVYEPPYNGVSVSAVIVEPGWAFSIATGSQW